MTIVTREDVAPGTTLFAVAAGTMYCSNAIRIAGVPELLTCKGFQAPCSAAPALFHILSSPCQDFGLHAFPCILPVRVGSSVSSRPSDLNFSRA